MGGFSGLLRVITLFRGRWPWLLLGLLVTLAGSLAAIGLSAYAGAMFATGLAIAAPLLLRVLGPSRVVLRYFERLTTHDALFRALADLRVWFFRGLATRLAGGLGMQRAGDVLARLVGDVEAQDVVYMRILMPLIVAILVLPLLGILIGARDVALAVGLCGLFAVAAFVLPFWAARGSLAGGAALAQAMAGLRVATLDTLVGLREVRAFAAEGRMLAHAQGREAALIAAQRRQMLRLAITGAGAFLCTQLALLLTLLAAPAQGPAGIALLFLVLAGFETVSLLPRAGAQAGAAAAAAARVIEAAEGPVPLPDPARPAALPKTSALRFEAVVFRWQPDRPLVFDGLMLDIPAGHRVALLGPSGSGKSTLAGLALRLAAPQQGRILLGGTDIATLAATELRSRIGWLSQSTYLFDDTIRANLLLARPDADDAALWSVLEQAQIADAVRDLPDGLDAYLGEGGHRFSGGQGRRLALARALLSPAKILILDEPCAGLDAETERDFLTTLNSTADNRTIILIAHRLTGVERLDRIFRLSAGKAVAAAG
jgi:ATP-binding cassette subfamily C protein CydC